MEKLQKALKLARESRDADAPRADSVQTPVTGGGAEATRAEATGAEAAGALKPLILDGPVQASDIGQAWAALNPLDLDPDHLIRNRVFALKAGPDATRFDILRTKVQIMMRKNGWSRLAITSPTPACGKTTIACNLAVGFSRQPEFRVVMVELDLHRPNMAQTLGFEPVADVTSVLSGKTGFAQQAVRLRQNVAISAARRSSGDPTAILLNPLTQATLAEIEQAYAPDLMIFDLPPLLTSDDTRAFLNDVDCALMVVRAETSTGGHLETCEREISEHTNFLGVVLNQCRHISDDYDYGYGYGAEASDA